MLLGATALEAKTKPNAHSKLMQAGFAGSVKMVSVIFSVKRPPTTPLMEWAKAATERARQERLTRQAVPESQVPAMTEDEMRGSRDRD